MRLLLLTPQLPHPPRQGTAIRNWGILKSLSARHRITLLTFATPDEEVTAELRAACERVVTVAPPHRTAGHRLRALLTSPLPDLAHRLASDRFAASLAELVGATAFGALIAEGLELAPFVFTDSGRRFANLKVVYDAHNAETILQRRTFENDRRMVRRLPAALYSLIQAARLSRYEAHACRMAHHVTCVSQEDCDALGRIAPGIAPVVVPNGIFVSDYAHHLYAEEANAIVFTGKMDYRPNIDAAVWFARDILPLVRRRHPKAVFYIVGQKPTEAVRQLQLPGGVVVTGAVDDARAFIGKAAVYVAPLRMGGGTRFKLLEAMALKRAIVSTALGAEGFALTAGGDFLQADDPQVFAQKVIDLLDAPALRQKLGEAGYAFVQGYDWQKIMPVFEQLLT